MVIFIGGILAFQVSLEGNCIEAILKKVVGAFHFINESGFVIIADFVAQEIRL